MSKGLKHKASPRLGHLLLDLGRDLIEASVVRRPSTINKSPWVADVRLKNGRIALAHVPALDMGGLCIEGSKILLKPAIDSKGKLVGANSMGSYGKPKCEFIIQLVRVNEPENKKLGGVWCAAHPSLGEKLAHQLLESGLVKELHSPMVALQKEVSGVAGCPMRSDFVTEHKDKVRTVIEVKTVLNTDYNPSTAPNRKECVYLGDTKPYQRAGIFPWGRVSQVGPKGEKVVSARAIKHIDELASIASGRRRGSTPLKAMLLFVAVRHDVKFMRVNQESCKSFALHSAAAAASGVTFAAHRIRWGEGKNLGRAYWDGPLKVNIPGFASRKRTLAAPSHHPKAKRTA
jgi:DNA-binding sugar fermentation-stimulating protein